MSAGFLIARLILGLALAAHGAEETGRGQEPAPQLAEAGRQREEHAGPEAEAGEEPAGAGEAIAAEPAEELLRTMRGHHQTEDEADQEETFVD